MVPKFVPIRPKIRIFWATLQKNTVFSRELRPRLQGLQMFLVGLRGGKDKEKFLHVFPTKGKKILPKVMPNLKNNDFLVEVVAKLAGFKKFRGSNLESSCPLHSTLPVLPIPPVPLPPG